MKHLFVEIWHRILAWLYREFWTLCPRCGKSFGGHQAFGEQVVFPNLTPSHEHPGELITYRVACHRCFDEAKSFWTMMKARLK